MHGQIGAALQHRHLQFLQEQALAADRRQRLIENFVAACGQRHQFHLQPRDARRSNPATCSACHSARALLRVAMRKWWGS
jgi:hypothetical protein